MIDVRDQRSAVRNQRAEINRRDAQCAELFLYARCASVVKSISDLRVLISGLCALLFVLGVPVEAQQPAWNVARIGYLATASGATELPYIEAFRMGLRELGYVEGKNINIEYRYAEGRFERLPELAEELVRLKVEILVVPSATAAQAAKKSNVTIPIVMMRAGDPFSSGLVASLARPGGNVTGLYQYSPELLGKRLELLKEVVPKVSRFAFP